MLHGHLASLREATEASPQMTDASALDRWVAILENVSTTLVLMGQEIEAVDVYIDRRQSTTTQLFRSICLMAVCAVIMTAYSAMAATSFLDTAEVCTGIGVHLTILLGIMAVINMWVTMVRQRFNRFAIINDGPVMGALRMFKRGLSDKSIVRYVAASKTGSDGGSDNTKTVSAACKEAVQRSRDCNIVVNECTPLDEYPSVSDAIKGYCKDALLDMLDRLQELKNNVEQYERPTLWRCVTTGIDANFRSLAELSLDMVGPGTGAGGSAAGGGGITRSAVKEVLRTEVLPVMCLPAMEHTSFSTGNTGITVGTNNDAKSDSRAACWRRCMDDDQCKVAMYLDPQEKKKGASSGVCRISNTFDPVGKFTYAPERRMNGGINDTILVRRPADGDPNGNKAIMVCGGVTAASEKKRLLLSALPTDAVAAANLGGWCVGNSECDAVKDGHVWRLRPGHTLETLLASSGEDEVGASRTCVKTTPGHLFSMGAKANAVATLREQSPSMAMALAQIMRRHKYRISLESNRGYLDQQLGAYYGEDLYGSGLSAVVDEILARVKRLIKTAPLKARYIDPGRLYDKVAALTSDEFRGLISGIQRMQRCCKLHRDNFPTYRDGTFSSIMKAMLAYAFFVLVIVFITFVSIQSITVRQGGTKVVDSIKRISVVYCVMSMFMVILETTTRKKVVANNHNYDAIKNNGDLLLMNMIRAEKLLVDLRARVEENNVRAGALGGARVATRHTQSDMLKASAAVHAVQQGIESFDRCNYINAGVAKMPYPVVEVAAYGIVALIFLGVAVVVIRQMKPGNKFSNISTLLDARNRAKRGEFNDMKEVEWIVGCCTPEGIVWELLVWFSIVMLFIISWWFQTTSTNMSDDYKNALDAEQDCT